MAPKIKQSEKIIQILSSFLNFFLQEEKQRINQQTSSNYAA